MLNHSRDVSRDIKATDQRLYLESQEDTTGCSSPSVMFCIAELHTQRYRTPPPPPRPPDPLSLCHDVTGHKADHCSFETGLTRARTPNHTLFGYMHTYTTLNMVIKHPPHLLLSFLPSRTSVIFSSSFLLWITGYSQTPCTLSAAFLTREKNRTI